MGLKPFRIFQNDVGMGTLDFQIIDSKPRDGRAGNRPIERLIPFLRGFVHQACDIDLFGVFRDAGDGVLGGECVQWVFGVFRRSGAAANADRFGFNDRQKGIRVGGIGTMVPAFEQLHFRELVHFHERCLAFLFQIPREQVMVFPVGEKGADGVIVLVAGLFHVELLIQDFHA